MITRAVIVLAVGVWAVVAVAALLQSPSPGGGGAGRTPSAVTGARAGGGGAASPSLVGLPFRSVTVQLQRTDWIDRYLEVIDEIADLGADTVKFVVDPRMEHGESNRIYLDLRMVPSVEATKQLVAKAKSRDLWVILMPIVLLDAPRKASEWRGSIKPENWDKWFESYTDMMVHFAWLAEASGVDLLIVGSELVSSERQVALLAAGDREGAVDLFGEADVLGQLGLVYGSGVLGRPGPDRDELVLVAG
jgi:hypothetical protein